MTKFSFIIPCYGSEKTILIVVKEIQNTVKPSDSYEIILVNDCSPDNVQDSIDKLCEDFENIRGITFAKNFGQHSATLAGLREAKGQYICYLDDDGQCPVSQFYQLFEAIEQGAHVSMAHFGKKKQSAFKNFGSYVNDIMANQLIGKPRDLQLSSFIMIQKFIRDEVIKYTSPYPYIFGLLLRATRNIVNVPMEHRHRLEGNSTFTFSKLVNLWLNGFISFSIIPLRITTLLGFLFSMVGVGTMLYLGINKILNPSIAPLGWTSIIATMLLLGGLQLFMLGMLGEYVGRSFITLNNAPQYVISKKVNFK